MNNNSYNDYDIDQKHLQRSTVCDVDCQYVSLNLPDGYKGRGRVFDRRGSGRSVIYLHGIQSHGGWFVRSCDYLRNKGMTVLLPDRRGSGLNRRDRGHCKNVGQLLDDLDCWVDWLLQLSGDRQVDIVAVSWGGKLALAYAAAKKDKVRSVVLVAPGLCPKIDVSLKEKIAIGLDGVVNRHKLYPIPLTQPQLFTENPEMMSFIADDPLMLRQATASFFVASKRLDFMVRQAIRQIGMPVSLFLAGLDRIIDNKATVALLDRVLKPTKVANGLAKEYAGAHHTLDFEPDHEIFFADVAKSLG